MFKVILLATMAATTLGCARATFTEAAVNGKDGQSCEVTQLANGAIITCATSSAVVYNGTNGVDGTNGRDGAPAPVTLGIAGYIKPCGAEFANDEVFLRMTDGNILALYDGGPNLDRLVLLAPGNYQSTDANSNQSCTFTVTPDLQITNEVRR